MNDSERQFKGIWIPKEIWLTKELTLQEKVVLIEVDSLETEERGCYASNKYFSEFFNLSTQRISQIIKGLETKGFIRIDYITKDKQIIERQLRIQKPPYPEVSNIFERGIKYSKGGYQENFKENNTSINNININNKEIYKESFEELWKLYPNKKGKTESYKKFVKAIKDGVSIETIRDGIQRYIAYIEIEHIKPQYIKNGSTWFNQRCWEDDYSTNRKPTTRDIAPKIKYMDFLKEDSND